jgi:two-component system response regulator YesN
MKNETPARVLLVDDDPQMVRLVEAVIHKEFPRSIQIMTAVDAAVASQYLEANIVDLLITDLEMPGLNGLELLRIAKRRNVWTQVLLLTGHSNLDALINVMESGASDYLLKPLDRHELTDAVQAVLSRLHRWRKALAGTLSSRNASVSSRHTSVSDNATDRESTGSCIGRELPTSEAPDESPCEATNSHC